MALSNSQYDAIMRIYNQRQFADKREQDERILEVCERIPQVEALSDEITATLAKAARRMLKGDTEGAALLKKEAAERKEQKLLSLTRGGYPADYLDLHYRCRDCRDTGYRDGKKCQCFKKLEIDLLYNQSNIREQLEKENFDTLSMDYYDRERVDEKTGMTVYDYMRTVIGWCRDFVDRFDKEKGSILFTGNTGCGKTFLSNCIARELINRCHSVIYLTASDMFEILAESKFSYKGEDELRDRAEHIMDCDLLIIDDLGTELINTLTSSQLFYCVNERLNQKKGTIISTNLTLNRVREEFTERVSSRIMSEYRIIPLIGEDLRPLKRGYKLG